MFKKTLYRHEHEHGGNHFYDGRYCGTGKPAEFYLCVRALAHFKIKGTPEKIVVRIADKPLTEKYLGFHVYHDEDSILDTTKVSRKGRSQEIDRSVADLLKDRFGSYIYVHIEAKD